MKTFAGGKTTWALISAAALIGLAAGALLYMTAVTRWVYRTPYSAQVERCSAQYGVEPCFVYAVMKAESGFDRRAKSAKGAVGLMQITPPTGRYIAGKLGREFCEEDLYDPCVNIEFGTWYLGYLLGKFGAREAIAAYNAGEGKVREWLRDPGCSADGVNLSAIPFPETERYVRKVEKNIAKYRKYHG